MAEILPGVHQLQMGAGGFPGFLRPNAYLVTEGGRALVVDTGYDRPEDARSLLDLWGSLGRPQVAAVVLTHRHPDHAGGARALGQALGAPIVCHPEERVAVEGRLGPGAVVKTVADGDRLEVGGLTLRVVHTPGHTPGSICLLLEGQGALFTGDTVLGLGTSAISPREGDMALYMDSLRRLRALGPRYICPGHGPLVRDAVRKLEELLAHRLERERQVLQALEKGPRTAEDLLGQIYPELEPRLHGMAKGQILAHLRKLEREGRVTPLPDGTFALKE